LEGCALDGEHNCVVIGGEENVTAESLAFLPTEWKALGLGVR